MSIRESILKSVDELSSLWKSQEEEVQEVQQEEVVEDKLGELETVIKSLTEATTESLTSMVKSLQESRKEQEDLTGMITKSFGAVSSALAALNKSLETVNERVDKIETKPISKSVKSVDRFEEPKKEKPELNKSEVMEKLISLATEGKVRADEVALYELTGDVSKLSSVAKKFLA